MFARFSNFVNEDAILVNDKIPSGDAISENVQKPERKTNYL